MAKNLQGAIIDKGLLECCICTETLKDPRSLPCGHSLCLQCLEDDCKARAKNGKYPCPYCRQEVKISEQGIAVIRCNMIVKNLVDLMKQHDADYPCATCQDGAATSVCITCEGKSFCGECLVQHLKHTSSHHIASLQEFREGKHDDAMRALQSSQCEQHNERYKYYCNKCKKLLCPDCVNLSCCRHTDSRQNINQAHEAAKNNLREMSYQVTEKLKRLDEQNKKIQENDTLSNNTLLEQSQIIKDYYQTLMERLVERDIQNLQKMYDENHAKRDELKIKSQNEHDCLKSLRQQMSNIISYGTATETLQLEQPLIKEVEESDVNKEPQRVPEALVLRYVPTYPECTPPDVEKVSEMLGGVAQCVMEFDARTPGEEKDGPITGLAVLPSGDILSVDGKNHKLKRYNNKGESVDQPLVNAQLKYSCDVMFSPDGRVMVSCSAGVMTFGADGRTQLQTVKPSPAGLALTSKNQVVVTSGKRTPAWVRMYSPDGELVWEVIGEDDKGDNIFGKPNYVSVNKWDDIIVGDVELNAVFVLDKHGEFVTKYAFTSGPITGVCVDKRDFIYVANIGSHTVVSLTPDGHFHRVVLSKPDVICPFAVTFDTHGHLLISCKGERTKTFCSYVKVFRISFAKV